jgi:hypothetical protein
VQVSPPLPNCDNQILVPPIKLTRPLRLGGSVGVSKAIANLVNAYLALAALLQSKYVTPSTREKIRRTLQLLNREVDQEVSKQQGPNQGDEGEPPIAAD